MILRTSAVTAALVMIGAAGAQAVTWTWAASGNPIKMSGGGGYGKVVVVGPPTTFTLQSWLSDTKLGDGRIYADLDFWRTNAYGSVSSGRRADGESSYARMADKSVVNNGGSGRWTLEVQTCRDVTLNDPCSEDKRVTTL